MDAARQRRHDMVLDEELRPLHKLTPKGEEDYRKMLEQKADEILFKHQHPLRWMIDRIFGR